MLGMWKGSLDTSRCMPELRAPCGEIKCLSIFEPRPQNPKTASIGDHIPRDGRGSWCGHQREADVKFDNTVQSLNAGSAPDCYNAANTSGSGRFVSFRLDEMRRV